MKTSSARRRPLILASAGLLVVGTAALAARWRAEAVSHELADAEAHGAKSNAVPGANRDSQGHIDRMVDEAVHLGELTDALSTATESQADPLERDMRAQELLAQARTAAARCLPLAEIETLIQEAADHAASAVTLDMIVECQLELLARRMRWDELSAAFRGGLPARTLDRLEVADVLRLEACAANGKGLTDDAVAAWTSLATRDPGAQGLCAQAELALLEEDYAEAAGLAQRASKLDPDSLWARELWARGITNDTPERALAEFEALLELAPDHLGWRVTAGTLAHWLGSWGAAVEHLDAAIQLGEGRTTSGPYWRRGESLWHLARYADALRDFELLVGHDPGDLGFRVWRALCWRGAGQGARAQEDLRALQRERAPELAEWLQGARDDGRLDQAVAWIEEALGAEPEED